MASFSRSRRILSLIPQAKAVCENENAQCIKLKGYDEVSK